MDHITKLLNTPFSQLKTASNEDLLLLVSHCITENERLKFENWKMRMHYGPDVKKFKAENTELKRELEELKEVQ
jgi:regulator of replication initiation timing